MKKILFATTALVATAGVAAADVTFGGYGRFGMRYDEDATNSAGQKDETRIESRFRLTIDADTQSDNGITFGARVRIQADESSTVRGAANTAGFNGARFHAETGGFRVEVGNIAGAIDNMAGFYGFEPGISAPIGQYSNAGLEYTGYTSTGAGVNGVSGIYSVGGFRMQVAGSKDLDGPATIVGNTITANGSVDAYSIGFGYTFGAYTVAIAHERQEDDGNQAESADTALTFSGSMGALAFAMVITDDSDEFSGVEVGEGTSYGFSGTYDIGAATKLVLAVSAGGDDQTTTKDTSYGLGVRHDLGGGVMLQAMVGRNSSDKTVADAGVQFNF